jgi:hypothetical protein
MEKKFIEGQKDDDITPFDGTCQEKVGTCNGILRTSTIGLATLDFRQAIAFKLTENHMTKSAIFNLRRTYFDKQC